MKFLICFAFYLLPFALLPQSSTLEIHKEKTTAGKKDLSDAQYNRVMVIPFEQKMYMSQIDKEISEKTGKTEIREIFRKGITNNVFIEAKMVYSSAYKSLSMYSEDPEIISDLDYIYKSIGYKYVPIPVQPDTAKPTAISTLQKASDKAQEIFDEKSSEKKSDGTKIQDGQIVSNPDNSEKYMSTSIVNPEMLAHLSTKYESDFFVFINQIDLVVPPNTDYRDLSSDNYSRLIKIHYTILHKNGTEIYGGAAKTYFSSRENDAQAIVNSQFDDLAKEIVSHLANPNQPKAIEQKHKEEQKKAKQHKSSYDDY